VVEQAPAREVSTGAGAGTKPEDKSEGGDDDDDDDPWEPTAWPDHGREMGYSRDWIPDCVPSRVVILIKFN